MDGLEDKLSALLGDAGAMAQIRRLAESLSGAAPPTDGVSAAAPPAPDGRASELLGAVMRAYAAPSEAARLVAALKPCLQPERAARLEKALRVARLAQAAKTALPELLPGARRGG